MIKTSLAVLSCAALLSVAAIAQDHAEFQGLMKSAGGNFGSLRKSVPAKQGPEAAASAEKLAAVFEKVQAHFAEHDMEDGVNFAKTAHEASQDLASAANSGNWDKAAADLKEIGGTCQGCHAAHREKMPDGTYKMK